MKTIPSNPLLKAALFLLAVGVSINAGPSRLHAQEGPPPDQAPGAGYKVGTITVKFVGTANVNEQVVRANMQLHEGGDLDDTILDRDIRNLYKTGLFEYIQTKWEAAGDRAYNLTIEVTPKFRVLSVNYVGNKLVKSSRLGKEVKTKPNTALDDRQVKEDSEKIREYYQKEGYNQVAVTYKVDRDRSTGFGTITFQIKEGNKVRIADIRFVGNDHIKTKALRHQMDTKKWWMFSWLTGSGRFKDDAFDDDLDKLREYYREDGYLDVEIAEDKVVFEYPRPDRLVLIIAVTEGRQYRVGQIAFSGNKLHSSSLLRRVVRQKPGAVFAPSKLDKDAERLEDFYGKDGYLYTNVKLIRKPNIVTGNIDIEYQVDEGERYNVESIVIEGNTKSKSVVILRELVLGPGDVFDTYRMKVSKLRLENTRFFDDVNVTHQSTNLPGRENMRVAVKEGRTGSLTFGAGYSSLERATVFAEISQSNFDLFNSRSLFQGDGQKFRIRLELGELSSEAIISFEEPYFLEKELALGFSIFRTSSDYESTYYDEVDVGASVYLRKHLFEQIQAQLGYTFEVVEIQNVSTSASPIIQAAAGNNTESKVNLELLRDTRDKIVSATSGNRIELDETVAGGILGGHNNYYKTESPRFAILRGLRGPGAGPGIRRPRRRDPKLRQQQDGALLRCLVPRRPRRFARLPVPLCQSARHLRGAGRRQDLHDVHGRILPGYCQPDPFCPVLRRGRRQSGFLRFQPEQLSGRFWRGIAPFCHGRPAQPRLRNSDQRRRALPEQNRQSVQFFLWHPLLNLFFSPFHSPNIDS